MTVLQRLRRETAERHERLETQLDVLARCADPAAYAELLGLLHGVHAPLEPALDDALVRLPVVDDWSRRRRLHLLEQDLRDLGLEPAALPATDRLPDLSSSARVLGCLYVHEGATLGGAVISRAARPLPVRFLDSYGSERGALWRDFRRQAEQWVDVHGDEDSVVAGAQDTFDVFLGWCVGAPA